MDLFDDEIVLFFRCLFKQQVKFIIVGGLAVNYHGFNRSTGDIDVWLDDTKENRSKFVQAVKDYGIDGADLLMNMPFIAGYTELMLDNGLIIDLMSDMKFFKKENFNECHSQSRKFILLEDIELSILNINHLISEKENSIRIKDIQDAEELKRLYRK